jgi:hypothetical protein
VTLTQKEARRLWVEALRSGKYKQGTGALHRLLLGEEDQYCPLGVACEVARRHGIPLEISEGTPDERHFRYYNGLAGAAPMAVAKWLGLRSPLGAYGFQGSRTLSDDNDVLLLPFAKIADIIESEPEGLFE